MKKGTICLAILLAMISFTPLFANGAKEEPAAVTPDGLSANIEYWSSWNSNEMQASVMEAAAKEFMKLNPGVKINFTFNGRDNRFLVGTAIQSGTKITMMDANADNVNALWRNYLTDVTEYYEKTYPTTDGKKFIDCLLPSMTGLSQRLFGNYSFVPFVPQAFMIFCNKGIFEECGITKYPETWDEFLSACEAIKAHGYIPITSDDRYNTSWFGYYLSRLVGDDRVLEIANDSSQWNSPEVREAATAIADMAKKGYFDPNIGSNAYPTGQQSMVINEKIAMCINGTWLPNEVYDTTPDDYKWGQFAFPTVPGGVDDQSAGCYSTYAIAFNNKASEKEIEAAFAFAAFLTTKYDQSFADDAKIVPVNVNSTWPDNLKEARDVLFNYSVRYPAQTSIKLNSQSTTVIQSACQRLMAGAIDVDQFIAEASKF